LDEDIPKVCYYCGDPLDYVPSCPNQLDEDRPLIKWVCRACWMERHVDKSIRYTGVRT